MADIQGKYRALALDLDGTLLNEEGALEPQVIAALRKAVAAGVSVHLVSGRMYPAVVPFWEAIGLTTPIISYNGAKIETPGEPPICDKRLEPDFVRRVFDWCRVRDLNVNAYFEDRLYLLKDNEYGRGYGEYFRVPVEVLNDRAWPGDAPAKLLIIARDSAEMQRVSAEADQLFGGEVSITTSSGKFYEFLPAGVNKATGLAVLAEKIAIPLEQWVAVGDGMNDIEMLQECGMGLAVANAPQEVLEKVARVVPPLPRGGIEVVLREFFGVSV